MEVDFVFYLRDFFKSIIYFLLGRQALFATLLVILKEADVEHHKFPLVLCAELCPVTA